MINLTTTIYKNTRYSFDDNIIELAIITQVIETSYLHYHIDLTNLTSPPSLYYYLPTTEHVHNISMDNQFILRTTLKLDKVMVIYQFSYTIS